MRFLLVLVLTSACTLQPPPEAWRTVPSNCSVEYNHNSTAVASYCLVPQCKLVCEKEKRKK